MDLVCIEGNTPITNNTQLARLGTCEVCGDNVAKYTCPRCEVKTCRLKCARIHRKELDCDGTRDKTRFVPLKKFTNLELSSDYRLLEEITRSVESFKKNKVAKFNPQKGGLPYHLYMLQLAANERKIKLKFLPKHFVRHKENTTYLKFRVNIIYWHIDWIFFNTNSLKVSDTNVPETARLSHLLHKYVVKQDDAILQEKLQYYYAASLPNIKIFLKAEQKAGCKFYELDPLLSLKDNLKNKVIIEYPSIHIVLKDHVYSYNVIDSDHEEEIVANVQPQNGHNLVNQIIKRSEKEDSIDNSLKNLLFGNEDHTESEMSD